MAVTKEIEYKLVYRDSCEMCDSSDIKLLGKRLNKAQGKSPEKRTGVTISIMQCKSCGLIYPEPLPIPLNIQDHYGVDPEKYWVNGYFEPDEKYFSYELSIFEKLYGKIEGSAALDVGAGIGNCMKVLNKAGFDAYGLEPSDTFHKMATEKAGINPERMIRSTIEDYSFKSDFFDFVTFGAVLEHLYHPKVALRQSIKSLKAGGLVHIEVPSADWLIAKLANLFYKFKGQDYVANLSPMHSPYHLYEFTLDSFNKIGEELGFEVVHYDYYVCQTYAPKFLDKFLSFYMKKKNKGMQLSVWLKKKS
jgi:ubiquinone/menaquinone biosynthesis C-methylase UbiE